MPAALDIVALRSLAAIVDCGGFRRAAETLHISQSAVSQHVRRLEKAVGQPLVARSGRVTRFTPAGELLVSEARSILAVHDEALRRLGVDSVPEQRTITIGATEHAADFLLAGVTETLAERFPAAGMRVRLDRGAKLAEAVHQGRLDLAILLGTADDAGADGGEDAGALPLSWFAALGWVAPPIDRPLPLVAVDDPCTIRKQALRALAEAKRPAMVVAEGAYLAGVLNAVRAGLGVALLADVGPVPQGLERRRDLPAVAPQALHVRSRAGAPPDLVAVVTSAVRASLAFLD
jgi:DNA-binding transcriptional LysR family regulator